MSLKAVPTKGRASDIASGFANPRVKALKVLFTEKYILLIRCVKKLSVNA